jgi:DNA adenine methylase Dam
MNNIKGLFSYSGNKFRIYKSVLSNIMSEFKKIHEPFLGSGVCLYNSKDGGIGIDNDKNIIALHNSLFDENLIYKIKSTYDFYFKFGRNSESYYKLRDDFNESYRLVGTDVTNVHMLHLLVQLSFNSLLRFSKNGYNVPFGRKEADIKRIEVHQNIAFSKNIKFINGSYKDLELNSVDKKEDLIYLDPPYIASKFRYNGWNKKDELDLLNYLDELNSKGYKFLLSNTFKHRSEVNEDLIEWSKKYNIKNVKMTYNSWSASVSSVKYEDNTKEVIIYNF